MGGRAAPDRAKGAGLILEIDSLCAILLEAPGSTAEHLGVPAAGRRSTVTADANATTREQQPLHHPVVVAHKESRAADLQLRIADAITGFAGSMRFVYI